MGTRAVFWVTACVTVLMSLLAVAPIVRHAARATDPYRFSDDVRVFVPAFYRDHGGLCRNDYTLAYNRVWSPPGYVTLYDAGSRFMDPAIISKVLPYPLLVALIALVAAIAKTISGRGRFTHRY